MEGPGLFGKLPAKGDFLTRGLPPLVLQAWEGWLQTVLAASRDRLGPVWGERWRQMPVWRFWIGPDVFGVACAGALMASADRVGRPFPLMLILPERGEDFPPPPVVDAFEPWYAALEARLRDAFGRAELADPGVLLEGLAPDALPAPDLVPVPVPVAVPEAAPDPDPEPDTAEEEAAAAEAEAAATDAPAEAPAPDEDATWPADPPAAPDAAAPLLWPQLPRREADPGRALWAMAEGNDPVALLADVAAADHYRAAAGRSYWWTAGGPGPAAMIALQGLPDPAAFVLLMQGGHA